LTGLKAKMTTTDKTADYYVSLSYPVCIYPEPDGSGHAAEMPNLSGCLTCADTLTELWAMIEDAKRIRIEGSLEVGLPC
jgi:antitoxin HicB